MLIFFPFCAWPLNCRIALGIIIEVDALAQNNWEDLLPVSSEVLWARSRDSMLCRGIVLGDESGGHRAGAEMSSDIGERARVSWAVGEAHSESAHGLFLSLFSLYKLRDYVNEGCSYLRVNRQPVTLGAVLTVQKKIQQKLVCYFLTSGFVSLLHRSTFPSSETT